MVDIVKDVLHPQHLMTLFSLKGLTCKWMSFVLSICYSELYKEILAEKKSSYDVFVIQKFES